MWWLTDVIDERVQRGLAVCLAPSAAGQSYKAPRRGPQRNKTHAMIFCMCVKKTNTHPNTHWHTTDVAGFLIGWFTLNTRSHQHGYSVHILLCTHPQWRRERNGTQGKGIADQYSTQLFFHAKAKRAGKYSVDIHTHTHTRTGMKRPWPKDSSQGQTRCSSNQLPEPRHTCYEVETVKSILT